MKQNLSGYLLTARFVIVSLLVWVSLTNAASAQKDPNAIVGEWLSDQKDRRIQIYRQGGSYFGRITWGTGTVSNDEKNPNPTLRNRPLLGLVLLQNLRFDGKNTWQDGTIYDPREGKTYACKVSLESNNRLNIRGFMGLSMFGRTDVWTRVPNQ
ncbi:DUF2147 domain-containing protein [Rudanella paleaurantiibacter]|uniref:DUF2147 domain-containing protein n=1 Tax=Rudanella paleaurantiibacter TaxID=2614655 RepID=A0A7J5TTQ6_9BACT|nr:DUF2147 domain-containing protein [Rudanella paleaurantiibacter]KAB7727266.1 DUF2147 domain-containing protein [Rudanella paleaurantiibacter]